MASYPQHQAAEERRYEAGGGVWFHNETNEKVVVTVQFYPRVRLRLCNSKGEVSETTLTELQRDYHRLRV